MLPRLVIRAEGERFCHQPLIGLQDQDQKPLPVSVSRLDADKNGLLAALEQYNRRHGQAAAGAPPGAVRRRSIPRRFSKRRGGENAAVLVFAGRFSQPRERFLAWVRQRQCQPLAMRQNKPRFFTDLPVCLFAVKQSFSSL